MAGTDGNNAFASFALAGGYVSAAVAVSPGEAPATREGKGGRVVRPRESASGEVEVMCKRCRDKRRKVQMEAGKDEGGAGAAARRAWLTAKQGSLTAFFGATANGAAGGEAEAATPAGGQDDGAQVCARCRAPIDERPPQRLAAKPREDPIVGKLKSYHRIATESGVKFAMTDGAAAAVMRNPCAFCGHIAPPGESNGLTRLRSVPSESGRGVMGDFSEANVDAACARCNFAKGSGRPQPFVGICRHIASHLHERAWTGAREALDAHEVPDDISDVSLFPAVLQRVFGEYGLLREKPPSAGTFGHFPELFRNDVGKKCRSSYLSDNKTYSLTNEQFRELVNGACAYCGKRSDPSPPLPHFNGLDRLDSTHRLYTPTSCVACCSTCNMAKNRLSLGAFVRMVLEVAHHKEGKYYLQLGEVAPGDGSGEV